MSSKIKNRFSVIALAACVALTYSCSSLRTSDRKEAKGVISATKASVPGSGTISFFQKENEVEMKLNINFPSKANQSVAVHIHEHGDCGNEGNDAHGHWNPTKSKHGKWGGAEFHLGDIGNVKLDASGKGSIEIETDKWSVGTGKDNDIVGKGLIVHDGVDDYVTQPTGNAGSRIGCGVIQIVAR